MEPLIDGPSAVVSTRARTLWTMNRLRPTQFVALSLATVCTSTLLSGCSLVPDLAPESLAANKSACEGISSVWNSLSTVLDPAKIADPNALAESGITIPDIPAEIQNAIDSSTDAELDTALTNLKAQVDSFAAGGEVDASKIDLTTIAKSGAAVAARCALFGVTPNLTLPGM